MIKIMPVDDVVPRAAVAARQFATSERMAVAFAGATPDTAMLVQRLDRRDSYYYIVPFKVGGRETARMTMDATDATFLEASGIEKPGEQLPAYVPAPVMLRRLYAEADRFADTLRFLIRDGAVGQHPVLVWMPCAESSSPFLPFYQYSIGDTFLYYRVDGARFEQLTTGPA